MIACQSMNYNFLTILCLEFLNTFEETKAQEIVSFIRFFFIIK